MLRRRHIGLLSAATLVAGLTVPLTALAARAIIDTDGITGAAAGASCNSAAASGSSPAFNQTIATNTFQNGLGAYGDKGEKGAGDAIDVEDAAFADADADECAAQAAAAPGIDLRGASNVLNEEQTTFGNIVEGDTIAIEGDIVTNNVDCSNSATASPNVVAGSVDDVFNDEIIDSRRNQCALFLQDNETTTVNASTTITNNPSPSPSPSPYHDPNFAPVLTFPGPTGGGGTPAPIINIFTPSLTFSPTNTFNPTNTFSPTFNPVFAPVFSPVFTPNQGQSQTVLITPF